SVAVVRGRAVEALRELLATLAARRPVVLAIDDLQWADADSAALLVKLLEAPAPEGLVLAASFRGAEAKVNDAIAPYLEAVRGLDARAGEVDRAVIDVGPLAPDLAERLARETLATLDVPADDLAAAIAEESAGVPYYVEELAH